MNIEWLEKFFHVEDFDNLVFSNPEKHILDNEGTIIFALLDNQIVGTGCLFSHSDYYEIAKMGVNENYQGYGIGKNLLLKLIDIKIPLVLSSTLPIDNLKGHELNLKIVQHLHGNIYLSGIMGSSYLNPVEFKKENIKLIYQDLNYNSYPQLWGDFEKGLSVLDYIFNCGSEQVNQLLQEHKKLYINNNT